ncbi:hypothetical protein F5884DRAFT_830691 [Xylogone sp. PMI_703]|nr:hypothetical protein F5884DRAFT_830691 [Xylogone sp. PMI_703]
MAEAIAFGASIVAFLQLADRVIGLCKYYIETVCDTPHDLRIILIEISSLKAILENINFLVRADPNCVFEATRNLGKPNGALAACRGSLAELEKLFPADHAERKDQEALSKGQKRRKVAQTLTALAWPLKEGRARKLLDEITRHKTTITLALSTEFSRDLKEVRSAVKNVQQIMTAVGSWILIMIRKLRLMSFKANGKRSINGSNTPIRHLYITGTGALHENDTGPWILESKAWNDWVKKTSPLYLDSRNSWGWEDAKIPETPKLSARRGSIYYYCYFGHNQDEAIPFLQWVLSQLCRQARHVPRSIVALHEKGRALSIQQLLTGVAEILTSFDDVYIVIDAVDESQEPRSSMLDLLRTLVTDSRFEKIQLLASSREYLDIEYVLSNISVPVPMQVDKVQADIRKYVYTTLQTDRRFVTWPEFLRREVEDALAVGAKGM